MQEILSPIKAVESVCGRQAVNPGSYRISYHCLREHVAEGELLYQTMTGELLLLSPEETVEMLEAGSLHDELVARWFLVPEAFDECQLAQQVRQTQMLLTRHKPGITHYVIFTTTDCNARCHYCYELGRPRRTMTDEVAHDAAAFIMHNCKGNDVKINWFGGEPLFNRRAIDVIVHDLAASGVSIKSQMTTNGYLFDEALVRHACDVWHLGSVQVTLDGTEDVYNKIKAYRNDKGSAYMRVMDNIGLLAEAGIKVSVRLNMDAQNEQDLWRLSEELAERFGGNEKVHVYVALLRDFGAEASSHERWERDLDAFDNLQGYLDELGIGGRSQPRRNVSVNQCMADSDNSITILPDGRLGKCEHETEQKLIGSIYEDELDGAAIAEWKRTVSIPECKTCPFYPLCVRLASCDWSAGTCTEYDRARMRLNLTRQMTNALRA